MAERAGVLVARPHYYETEGLIESLRTSANHRRYDRRELRRIAITRISQSVGVPLAE
jgi:MerR family redox-sensitive transcriptional activator SoxR